MSGDIEICALCDRRITPCNCGAYGGPHWQDAGAPRGRGSRYCQGTKRLHELMFRSAADRLGVTRKDSTDGQG